MTHWSIQLWYYVCHLWIYLQVLLFSQIYQPLSFLIYMFAFIIIVLLAQTWRRWGSVAWRKHGELYILCVYVSWLPTRQLAFCSCYWFQLYTAPWFRRLSCSLYLLLSTLSYLATHLTATKLRAAPYTSPYLGVSRICRAYPITFCHIPLIRQTPPLKLNADTAPLLLGWCYITCSLPHKLHR